MKNMLLAIEFLAAIGLIITILLHSAKGEGLGSIGGGARLFKTQKGLEAGLNKVTTSLAIIFFVVAIILGITN